MLKINMQEAAAVKAALEKLAQDGNRALEDPATRNRIGFVTDQIKQSLGVSATSILADEMKRSFSAVDELQRTLAKQPDAITQLRLQHTAAAGVLTGISDSLAANRETWKQIARSVDSFKEPQISRPELPKFPSFTEQMDRVFVAQERRQRESREQQFQLLKSIADGAQEQNETMSAIAQLQELLVKEALENSRLQRTVLYFAAISALFALVALFK